MNTVTTPPRSLSAATQWADWLICTFFRHWLTLMLTPMLLFVTLPFLAPIAMNAGWTRLGNAIYWLYTPFCHQLPQRSWFFFGEKLTYSLAEINQVFPATDIWTLRRFYGTPEMGWKVAWSDRMISFYMLTPIFGLIYAALRQLGRRVQPLSLRLLLLALTPMMLDGFTHLLNDLFVGDYTSGFRDTNAWLAVLTANAFPNFYAGDTYGTFNWWMRLLTGGLAAWGLALTVFSFLDQIITREANRYCASSLAQSSSVVTRRMEQLWPNQQKPA
jgi:uncharacterized membrane protein